MEKYLEQFQQFMKQGLGIPLVVLSLLAMVVIPLPGFLLDVFFTFNITLSMVILIIALNVKKPLDFAIFPTIILITTLLRLALNIASTRVILLEGHNGTDAAGQVIDAFGNFVVGGNFAVGLVVFLILIVINFMVVTKGAGRVAEVSARFTLDSMPGKQMAIDADLNTGLIDQEEAQRRRREVTLEADFYGSMDGASKFVRGDAIAGIVILVINIIGGLSIGILQHGLDFSTASNNYVLLTIGDGLVAQLPALLLSVATGIVVTRVSGTDQDMGQQVSQQMFESPTALGVTAGIMGVMGMVPGMPNVAFLSMAALAGGGAYWITRRQQKDAEVDVSQLPEESEDEEASQELNWQDIHHVDVLGLEVGYRLIMLVDQAQQGTLIERIRGIRKKVSQELGFLVQAVHIRDNLELEPNHYRISVMGVVVGQGTVYPDQELAINPGQVFGDIAGTPTTDPTFGLDAVWIQKNDHDQAQALGYTVVDVSTVIATHISQIVQDYAHQLFGFEEAQKLVDKLEEVAPKLVEAVIPDKVKMSQLVSIMQNLLLDHVSLKDVRTILETLSEYGGQPTTESMVSAVRVGLGPMILQDIVERGQPLQIVTFDGELEQLLTQVSQNSPPGQLALDPNLATQIHGQISEQAQQIESQGQLPVLVTNDFVRPAIARFFRYSLSNLRVLAYTEIPEDRQINIVASVGQQAAA